MSGSIRPSPSAALLVPAFAVALCACSSTTDSLGYNGNDLWPISINPERTTTNVFASWLGKTPAEIDAKITATWTQLFYGDNTQKIYYIIDGTDQAEIRDTFHGDIRTEGFGYAMMIAVQLDKRTEFDRMWTYVKSVLSYPMTDPSGGYYQSICDSLAPSPPVSCNDPFGHAAVRDRAAVRPGSLGDHGQAQLCRRRRGAAGRDAPQGGHERWHRQ